MIDYAVIATIAGLLGISGRELLALIASEIQKRKQDRERKAREDRKRKLITMVEAGILTKGLRRYYSAENLRGGSLFPYSFSVEGNMIDCSIATRSEWVGLSIELASENEQCDLVAAPSPRAEVSIEETVRLLALLQEEGMKLWDSQIYRLVELDLGPSQMKPRFAIDSFLHYRFTDGLLLDEFVNKLLDEDLNIEQVIINSAQLLPQRHRILPNGRSFVDFPARVCTGGPLVVFAMARPKPDSDYVIPIQKRSKAVADGQEMLSVIPQAYHQHMIDEKKEINVSSSVYREVFEELFEGEEAEKSPRRLKHDWYMHESKPMNWLLKHRDAYTLQLVCAGINLHVGSYEFGVLFAIHDPAFWTKYGSKTKANYEANPGLEGVSSLETSRLRDLFRSPEWASEGLFAFVECMKRLEALDPKKVIAPSFETFVL
jgi:hypothetical protein